MKKNIIQTLKVATFLKTIFITSVIAEMILVASLIIINSLRYDFKLFCILLIILLIVITLSLAVFFLFINYYKKFIREKYQD